MDLIPIGEAAARLGLSTSALRYYDERGLVRPPKRQGGRRMYGTDELRRLALIKLFQRLGLPLETAAAVLDAPGPLWRQTVRDQMDELDAVIEQARGARLFLTHALNCPTEHPARECANMKAGLDSLIAGMSVEQLGLQHGGLAQSKPKTAKDPNKSATASNMATGGANAPTGVPR